MAEYKGKFASFLPIKPTQELDEYVDFYYQGEASVEGNDDPSNNISAIFLPIGSVEIAIQYNDTLTRLRNEHKCVSFNGLIIGPHTLRTLCIADNFGKVNKSFHIRFKPGGFYRLFGIYQSEIKNSFYTIDEVLGNEGRQIEERLNNSASLTERVKTVDSFLIRKKNASQATSKVALAPEALKMIERYCGRIPVQLLSKELQMSVRTLEWEFTHHIGLTPKEYMRIFRFKNVLNKMLDSALPDWAAIAQSGGYYDQAHLINEFKKATTLTPDLFLREVGRTFIKSINMLIFIKRLSKHSLTPLIKDFLEIEKTSSAFKN